MADLNIQFQNLHEDEIAKIEQLEDTFPGHVFVYRAQYGFDGMAFYQMIIALSSLDPQVQTAIVAGITAILVAIINRIPSETEVTPSTVFIVLEGGHTKKLTSREEIESLRDSLLPTGVNDES